MQGYEYQIIQTISGQVGYVTVGADDLPPMILLVGYSGNLLHWNQELVLKLSECYKVYLPDNRLVGESISHNEDSISGLAQDIADFIDALFLHNVTLVGWSMGGIIGQNLAIYHAEKINKVAILGSLPDYTFTHGSLHSLVADLRERPSKEHRDKLLHLFYSEDLTIEFRKYLARNILHINHYVYPFNHHAQQLQDKSVTSYQIDYELIKTISQPVVIFTARNDLVNKPEASYLLHQLIPNSQLISYASGGHFFINCYPQQIAQQIINFFVGK